MNERIRELAEQAGWMMGDEVDGFTTRLEKFATLVAQAEREACAELCEDMSGPIETYNPKYVHYIGCAKAIRARGQA